MKKCLILSLLVSSVALLSAFTGSDQTFNAADIKVAITKSIALLQPSDRLFLENAGTCHSCHHQDLSAITMNMARKKGYAVNDTIFKETIQSILSTVKARKATNAENNDPVAIIMSGTYSLWALAENGYAPGKNMALMAKNLMQRQTATGAWVSPNPRPPLEYYAFSATALVIRIMKDYAPASLAPEVKRRISKAVSWMQNEVPETNEEKVFQLLGLTWADGNADFIAQQAKKLLSAQRTDGGWSQLDSLQTDAYATGQSLYALHYSGQLKTSDEAYRRGVAFLLRTQNADGSWRIRSRSFPGVPFVETGFPEGGDQFISAAGSNWATMALLLAAEPLDN